MPRPIFKYILLVCSMAFSLVSWGQTTTIEEDIERKISLSPYVGVSFFPTNINYNDLGAPKNLFGGFSPAPMAGITAYYKYNRRIFFGVDGNFFITERQPLLKMNVIGLSIFGKINIVNPKKRLSPYIIAGLNVSFMNFRRNELITDYIPKDSAVAGDHIKATKIEYLNNKTELIMAPMFGPLVGVGLDVKITRRITAFVQATLHTNFGTNSLVKKNFPENESVLQYVAIRGGINIKLYKRMKFNIDSQAVKVPDLIAELSAPEDQDAQSQMLSREANFAVNLKEGLKHNVQIGTQNGEINMEVDQDTSKYPCPMLAVLYDQFGNKVAEQVVEKGGKVNFKGLDKGVFNVTLEMQPPCKEAEFSYKVTDPDAEVQKQFNSEKPVDSLAYNVEGFIDFKDQNASKENIQVMLVDQGDKKIKAKMVTRSDGSFAFKNLTPGNYRVVYEVGNPKIQSKIAYDIKTNGDSLVKKVDFPFNEIKKEKEGSRLMAGKLQMGDPSIAAYKVNLDLVDKYNRVVDKSVPNQDGSFEFIDKKSDENEIIYDLSDKKLADKSIEIKTVTYGSKVEEAKKQEAAAAKVAEAATNPTALKVPEGPNEMEMYKLYGRDGKEMAVEGFGFQVGAFRNMANVTQLMDKLKTEGFEVFVQAVMSNDVNTRFKSSQNYKFNRVIVFATNEQQKSDMVRSKLLDEGYTIIVKEHFKPGADSK
jgi:cell division septation protein DedD